MDAPYRLKLQRILGIIVPPQINLNVQIFLSVRYYDIFTGFTSYCELRR